MIRLVLQSIMEGTGIAIAQLRANKVRAALTIVGVAIGVFVVVAISAMVNGIYESVRREVDAAGSSTFYLRSYVMNNIASCDQYDPNCRPPRTPPISPAEAKAIEQLPLIGGVTAHQGTGGTVRYRDRGEAEEVSITAASATWIDVTPGEISPGRNFTVQENDNAAPVVIVDDKLARALFGSENPLERVISMNDVPFRVVGVYKATANPLRDALEGGERATARIPLRSGQRYFGTSRTVYELMIRPRPGVSVEDAVSAVTLLLRVKRGLRPGEPDNFTISTQDALLAEVNSVFAILFLVMFSLSSVSLMVGGVGVIAIMMISVTERTREIGVRKALGATKGAILWQFLVEAVTLTGIGASAGLVLGIALATVVSIYTPIPASAPLLSIVAALAMSAFTGLVFGIAPAMRAARLDPVEALRYE
jgi:putative ABC transport system permease protein